MKDVEDKPIDESAAVVTNTSAATIGEVKT